MQGWRGTLHIFKRKRILDETATTQWNGRSLERCFKAIRLYTQKRIRNNTIIDQFQMRSELTIKADILLTLHSNISISLAQRTNFYSKIYFLAEKRMEDPISQWKTFTAEAKQIAKADQFYKSRTLNTSCGCAGTVSEFMR